MTFKTIPNYIISGLRGSKFYIGRMDVDIKLMYDENNLSRLCVYAFRLYVSIGNHPMGDSRWLKIHKTFHIKNIKLAVYVQKYINSCWRRSTLTQKYINIKS